jgi:hypothetical protein
MAFASAVCFGLAGGFFAQDLFERPDSEPSVEAISFLTRGSTGAFPYSFEDRDAALEWLRVNVGFLDRYAQYDQRPVVDRLKAKLAVIESQPARKIERSLFLHVREEADLLRSTLAIAGEDPSARGKMTMDP